MKTLVKDLLGKNIAGIVAQVTREIHINSGIAPKRIRVLKQVRREKERNGWFLMLYWQPNTSGVGSEHFDCGFSGMLETSEDCKNWTIEIVE